MRTNTGILETSVYRKSVRVGQILQFRSKHSKRSRFKILFKRAQFQCSTEERRQKNTYFKCLCTTTTSENSSNGAPIESTIETTSEQTRKWNVLVYSKNIAEMTTKTLKSHGIELPHRLTTTSRKILSNTKEQVSLKSSQCRPSGWIQRVKLLKWTNRKATRDKDSRAPTADDRIRSILFTLGPWRSRRKTLKKWKSSHRVKSSRGSFLQFGIPQKDQ